MPGRLRRLSGHEVVSILRGFGFERAAQRGSHLKLFRVEEDGSRSTLTIPLHDEIDTGTLRAILRQAGRFVPPADLAAAFRAES